MRLKLALVLMLFSVAGANHVVVAQQLDEAPTSLSFGVVPQQSASKLARLWVPILTYVSERTGLVLNFETAKNIPTFERRLADGHYDLAYMNPYHYTVFHASPGYEALAKAKDRVIKGIVVVRKDSPLQEISELDGRTLAFPSPAAFAASVLPQASFAKMGIKIEPAYVSSHDSVYRTVAQGLYPAGGGIFRTLNSVSPEVKQKLRVLWRTDPYTPHAIAAHPRVAAEVSGAFVQALERMGEDPQSSALLAKLRIKGFEAATDAQWDDIRALGISLLEPTQTP